MPVAIGGRRKRNRQNPPGHIVKIERGPYVGYGDEGTVYRSKVTVNHAGRLRNIELAEKVYHPPSPSVFGSGKPYPTRRDVLFAQHLSELNRTHQLGLRFPTTIRYFKNEKGGYDTLTTFQKNIVHVVFPNTPGAEQFIHDIARQRTILSNMGIWAPTDCFFAVRDPKTNQLNAIISDFRTLKVSDDEKFRQFIARIKRNLH